MQYFRKIVGDRIYLSPRGASDEEIEKFTEWMNDFQVTDYINKSEQIMTAIGEKEWLENTARKNENKNFNIIDLNSNKLIGTIGLEKFNWTSRNAVLGIFIGDKNYRNNGYGTEAIKLLLEFGFKYLNLHSINYQLYLHTSHYNSKYINMLLFQNCYMDILLLIHDHYHKIL